MMTYDFQKNGWIIQNNALTKEFQFKSFADVMSFMMRCSFEIEKQNHHPEWKNVYNRLYVTLTTHDVGGITDKDYRLAETLDENFGVNIKI